MPVDEYIEDLTDGTPAVEGDLFVLQRNVAGVWTDFFIRSENVAGGGQFMADITIDPVEITPSINTLLPAVAGKAYVILDPPLIQVTGNSPTSLTGDVTISDGAGNQWSTQFNDTETDASYQMIGPSSEQIGLGVLFLQSSVFNGAALRVRFSFALADI